MTTVITPPESTQPTTPRTHKVRNGILIGLGAIVALFVGAGLATSSSHQTAAKPATSISQSATPAPSVSVPATPAAPAVPAYIATADKVLANDGYTLFQEMSAADIASSGGMIRSAAMGTRGDSVEVAIVSTPGFSQLFVGMYPGNSTVSVVATGEVVRISGPMNDVVAYATAMSASPSASASA
jgi:hypothetical protein